MSDTKIQRSVYAQGWFPGGRNYHPSLPPKRLSMVEDFAELRATMLSWPMLGGGGIALPYLEEEAYGSIPARFRQYGYVNDAEFIAACWDRGIVPFGVIFSTQGWDVPAAIDESGTTLLSINEVPPGAAEERVGLSAFSRNAHPAMWKSFESYFPDGLRDGRGKPVTDLFDECCARDIHGTPLRARWVEFADRSHICRFMNLNNPVWREYLKAIVRIQVDAGVGGIQFDEPDTPILAILYGGDFSRDTMDGFADYLRERRPADVAAFGLDDFHYGSWLLNAGSERVDIDAPGAEGALARHYVRYLRIAQTANFAEVAAYARSYAASRGRELLISSNLFDCAAWHDGLVPHVDVLVPEQRITRYQQPGWTRYAAAFAGDRSICVSVNPYGGILPELNELLKRGEGLTRYRTMMYESAALGAPMAVPYGAWMGTEIIDALWPPEGVSREIQAFVDDHGSLFGASTLNEVGVLLSIESNLIPTVRKALRPLDLPPRIGPNPELPSLTASEVLGARGVALDVLIVHDREVRSEEFDLSRFDAFRHLVIAGPIEVDGAMGAALVAHLHGGGTIAVSPEADLGELGREILAHSRTRLGDFGEFEQIAPPSAQATLTVDGDWAANIVDIASGHAAVHLIRYDAESVPTVDAALEVRVPFAVTTAVAHRPEGIAQELTVTTGADGRIAVTIPQLGPYAIVELTGEPAHASNEENQ